MNHGKIVIICGPSGVGKGTIIKGIINNKNIKTKIIKSYTTRPISDRDKLTGNHKFLNKDEFLDRMKKGDFVETNYYNGNYYGTLKSDLDNIVGSDCHGIIEQDIKHALITKKFYPDTRIFFIDSPLEFIRQRLIKRGENTDKEIHDRLIIAKKELDEKNKADYIVENLENNQEIAISNIVNIINKFE